MERETFIKYVEMLHRFERLSKEELSIYSNTVETKVISDVRKLVENNPELMDLLKKIHSLPDGERMRVVVEYFSKKEEKDEPAKNEEEEIAKTYGVDVGKIEHKFLSNGNEIFSFYDTKRGKQVVLENNQKGKSLVSYLKEIQEENEKYQSENAETNSNDILRDKSNEENIELQMLTKEEILARFDGFGNVAKEDASKLRYLLQNYERLKIKGINLENLIYIDEDNKIHEAVINEKQEVVIATPVDANYSEGEYEASDNANNNIENENTDSNELEDMIAEEENENDDVLKYTEGKIEEKEKPKVLKKDDKYGFINNVLFVAIITAVILIVILAYFIIKFYV